MSKVSVLDTHKNVLEPCHPAVARCLLRKGEAAVFKRYPFTIILKREVPSPKTTDHTLSIDPGSKCTGMAITDSENNIIVCFELHHRGAAIKKGLSNRAGYRRSRRTRKLRHRPARWQNRSRKAPILTANGWQYQSFGQSSEGWIAPSLMSRVFNIYTWVSRLSKIYPITQLAVEHVKFDTQLMENPEISGVEYQRGTLFETEVWEYLLEKFKRKCYYCGAKNVPLEKEHILPKAKGGTNRVSNLTTSCRECNIKKGNRHPDEIQGDFGKRVQSALRAAKKPLKDAQAVNTIRWKIVETLKATGLPVTYGTGGKTKYNQTKAGLPKTHYYDAACIVGVPNAIECDSVLAIHAVGYGHRQDLGDFQTKAGLKDPYPKFKKPYKRIGHCEGIQRLDILEMKGKIGYLSDFRKTDEGKPQKLRIKHTWDGDGRIGGNITEVKRIQKRDGYAYQIIPIQKTKPKKDRVAPVITGRQLTMSWGDEAPDKGKQPFNTASIAEKNTKTGTLRVMNGTKGSGRTAPFTKPEKPCSALRFLFYHNAEPRIKRRFANGSQPIRPNLARRPSSHQHQVFLKRGETEIPK
ncbi:HNH endonuclease [Candidatus Poribacteria bacterium]|nr:MAG: HNH endonuclease [Candidatus Poribacteria bacterium]